MLKVWNMALVLVAFYLAIFGTFVVRSGVITSVHSFAQSAIGPYFLTFLTLVVASTLTLFFLRLPRLRSENQLDSMLSREASFLVNNLLFLGLVFAIFWGTIFPLVSEAFQGVKVTVGPPYFNQTAGPMFLGLIFLMGIGPLMPWRKTTPDHLARSFVAPALIGLVATAIPFLLGAREPWSVIAIFVSTFTAGTVFVELVRGAAARHRSRPLERFAALSP